MALISGISMYEARIPFRSTFRHGAAERSCTEAILIQVDTTTGCPGYGEGCPRSYVTGESVATAVKFFRDFHSQLYRLEGPDELIHFVTRHETIIDRNPAVWCALELALLDAMAKFRNITVESLLGLDQGRDVYQYTAVIGDSSPELFHTLYSKYRDLGFTDFKIKLSNDLHRDRDKLECMRGDEDSIRVRADANNLWSSGPEVIAHLAGLDYPFTALEEPLQPGQIIAMELLHAQTGIPVILDESFLNRGHLDAIAGSPDCWIINARVSKFGGLLRSLSLIGQIARLGVRVNVGAQVGETSLLTRAALPAADVAGDALLAQEGAFSTLLLTQDPFAPAIRFGSSGRLYNADLDCRSRAGFGMAPVAGLQSMPELVRLD